MFDRARRDPHLSEQEMILLGDGELSRYRAWKAHRHMQHCWNCRGRFDALQNVIVDFVEHCEAITDRLGPAPNRHVKLRALRVPGTPEAEANGRMKWRSPLFASVLLALCGAGIFFYDGTIATARASEILSHARSNEVHALRAIPNAVIHQRLAVTANNRRAEWTCSRGSQGQELRSSWAGDQTIKNEFLRVYEPSLLNRDRPLSPASFMEWQTAKHAKTSDVRQNIDGTVTIFVRTAGGIERSSLTLTQPDLHATVETLQSGDQNFEIRELSYSITPAIDHMPEVVETATPVSSTAAAQPEWDEDNLEEAEATARLVLHEGRADTRFPAQFERRDRDVVVQMMVDTSQERDEWSKALLEIPGIVAEIWTPESIPASLPPANREAGSPAMLYRSSAPMADDLGRCLGSNSAADALIDRFHAQVRAALVPALALERLSVRYDASPANMAPDVEHKLYRIASDHWKDANTQIAQMLSTVAPALNGCFPVRENMAASARVADLPWREAGRTLARDIRTFDAYFNQLFTTQVTSKQPLSADEAITHLIWLSIDLQPSAQLAADTANARRIPK